MSNTVKKLLVMPVFLFEYFRCVDVTGDYRAKKIQMKISLAAIGLLWTATDFIAKGITHRLVEEKETC